MKVFEVITEYCEKDSKEITTMVEYVTSEKDTLLHVVENVTKRCDEYDREFKSIKEVLTIVEHIK